jgi:hypothetical protein
MRLTLVFFVALAGIATAVLLREAILPVSSVGDAELPVLASGGSRPQNIKELVKSSDVIVVGTIGQVVQQGYFAGYDETTGAVLIRNPLASKPVLLAGPTSTPDPSLPYTDFEILIEKGIRDDGRIRSGKPLVLRMLGRPTDGADPDSPYPMSKTGDRHLFFLTRNPDKESYGLVYGPYSRLNITGPVVTASDGKRDSLPFAQDLSPSKFMSLVEATVQE